MLDPISLYIHIPFCSKKCHYCHFYVIEHSQSFVDSYIEAITKEIALYKDVLKTHPIASIYFGGGTPSRLQVQEIEKIIHSILAYVTLCDSCELTIEVNPEDVNLPFVKAIKGIGFNRVSMGVQSFHESHLIQLGRTHNANKAESAVNDLYNGGFDNISIDLMYDLPYQIKEDWEKTVLRAVELPITHLSLYNLTIEPQTLFFKNKKILEPHLPDENLSLYFYKHAIDVFSKNGLEQYEISAFAKNKKYSIHNLGYWTGRPFLGLGPSAFSYWEGKRFKNVSHLKKYHDLLKESILPIDFTEKLEYEAKWRELFTIQLRLKIGINLEDFEKKNGQSPTNFSKELLALRADGFISFTNNQCQLTEKGFLFYDYIASELI
ncbi:MAG: hypothetical protein BGO10_05805 [Chlamydia sp. 32-24]|nr:MAG: hypothetical protein BGO10_05805 [Chlamydia sp. 32-24]